MKIYINLFEDNEMSAHSDLAAAATELMKDDGGPAMGDEGNTPNLRKDYLKTLIVTISADGKIESEAEDTTLVEGSAQEFCEEDALEEKYDAEHIRIERNRDKL